MQQKRNGICGPSSKQIQLFPSGDRQRLRSLIQQCFHLGMLCQGFQSIPQVPTYLASVPCGGDLGEFVPQRYYSLTTPISSQVGKERLCPAFAGLPPPVQFHPLSVLIHLYFFHHAAFCQDVFSNSNANKNIRIIAGKV